MFSYAGYDKWNCLCSCGSFTTPKAGNLRNGNTRSCGCLAREALSRRTHGLSKTRIYGLYHDMLNRCYRPMGKSFEHYGGRGISVCEEWRSGFETFHKWAMLNGYRRGLTLDRIKVNGNYEPSNCRFVTRKVSARNTRTNVFIEHNGEIKTKAEWAEVLNFPYKLLHQRMTRGGMSFSEAIATPLRIWPSQRVQP